jgi:NAD+ synthase
MFSRDVLAIDCASVAQRIQRVIKAHVLGTLRRRGVVVGLGGDLDSSVVAALSAGALGREKVLGLILPERDSPGDVVTSGQAVGGHLGVPTIVEDITSTLAAAGCYERQEEAVRMVFPAYDGDGAFTIGPIEPAGDEPVGFELTLHAPSGETATARMPPAAHRELVAATNLKQRARAMVEYYYADRLRFAVAGTPSRIEFDQGFFVKQGDGAADFKPIAHLYKTQVRALAEHLGLPAEVLERSPGGAPALESLGGGYLALPYDRLDLCLYALNHQVSPSEAAPVVELSPDEVERVYRDLESKRRATRYEHLGPLFVHPVEEVG